MRRGNRIALQRSAGVLLVALTTQQGCDESAMAPTAITSTGTSVEAGGSATTTGAPVGGTRATPGSTQANSGGGGVTAAAGQPAVGGAGRMGEGGSATPQLPSGGRSAATSVSGAAGMQQQGSEAGAGGDGAGGLGSFAGAQSVAGGGAGGGSNATEVTCDWWETECEEDAECGEGFACHPVELRCHPLTEGGRTNCGGFAGAACNTQPFRICLLQVSTICVSEAEAECACTNYGVGCDELETWSILQERAVEDDGNGGQCLPRAGFGCSDEHPDPIPCCPGLVCDTGISRYLEGECY